MLLERLAAATYLDSFPDELMKKTMTDKATPKILIGTAGWAIPKADRKDFGDGASVLERYATRLDLVEINSSFYRPHQRKTYERWAASVPEQFRFSIKAPRSITHDHALRRPARLLKAFVEQCTGLGPKLGVVLVQLPPSLAFEARVAAAFFGQLRGLVQGVQIVCEPRHESWLKPAAARVFACNGVSRVNVDPCVFGEPFLKSVDATYWRLHGSPHIYRSVYSKPFLRRFARHLQCRQPGHDTFVVFDNTAQGHATRNALDLAMLALSRTAQGGRSNAVD